MNSPHSRKGVMLVSKLLVKEIVINMDFFGLCMVFRVFVNSHIAIRSRHISLVSSVAPAYLRRRLINSLISASSCLTAVSRTKISSYSAESDFFSALYFSSRPYTHLREHDRGLYPHKCSVSVCQAHQVGS